MKKTILLFAVFGLFALKNQAQTITDYDGNVYHTVTIGTQVWMKENLKVTHYRNGNLIPKCSDSTIWVNLKSGARCYQQNDSSTYAPVYGSLYNWYSVTDSNNISPTDWHVPSDADWTKLIDYLGSDAIAGSKLKEAGYTHWVTPNQEATNSSGFTGLPGGARYKGWFYGIGTSGIWWSSSSSASKFANTQNMYNTSREINLMLLDKQNGYSVRCLRDASVQINGIDYKKKIEIYPNPSRDIINIDCNGSVNIKMQVYSSIGEFIIQKELNQGVNSIDVRFLSKGIYIIKLISVNLTEQYKLIKE